MQKIKKIINSLTQADFYDNVNLHIHTQCSDGKLSPEEVLIQAKKLNLKIISITDHNTMQAYKELENTTLDEITLIKGVEFDCWHGYTLLHILGYGIDIDNQELNELCANDKVGTSLDLIRFFNGRKAVDVIKKIKNAGGIPVLAHPACCWNLNLDKMIKKLKEFGLEGIEVYYPYNRHRGIIKFYTVAKVEKLAKKYNLLITGGTDCHSNDLSYY